MTKEQLEQLTTEAYSGIFDHVRDNVKKGVQVGYREGLEAVKKEMEVSACDGLSGWIVWLDDQLKEAQP
jgi:hypothetical protein